MPRTLQQTALWVAGPIDFVINLVINGGCPFLFLPLSASIPLFGIPSVAIFLAPMCFCVGFFPTFFGHRNGVLFRQGGGTLPPDYSWKKKAVFEGLKYAAAAELFLGVMLLGLYWLSPGQQWSVWQLAIGDGLAAAFLAYFFHVNAMLRAGR